MVEQKVLWIRIWNCQRRSSDFLSKLYRSEAQTSCIETVNRCAWWSTRLIWVTKRLSTEPWDGACICVFRFMVRRVVSVTIKWSVLTEAIAVCYLCWGSIWQVCLALSIIETTTDITRWICFLCILGFIFTKYLVIAIQECFWINLLFFFLPSKDIDFEVVLLNSCLYIFKIKIVSTWRSV